MSPRTETKAAVAKSVSLNVIFKFHLLRPLVIVGPDGVVYEKDLGPDTLKAFQSMDKYNPDKTWKVTKDDVEDDAYEQDSGSPGQ